MGEGMRFLKFRNKSFTYLLAIVPQYSVALGSWSFSQRYNLNNSWYVTLHSVTYLVILLLAWNKGLDKHIVTHLINKSRTRYKGCNAKLGDVMRDNSQ